MEARICRADNRGWDVRRNLHPLIGPVYADRDNPRYQGFGSARLGRRYVLPGRPHNCV